MCIVGTNVHSVYNVWVLFNDLIHPDSVLPQYLRTMIVPSHTSFSSRDPKSVGVQHIITNSLVVNLGSERKSSRFDCVSDLLECIRKIC